MPFSLANIVPNLGYGLCKPGDTACIQRAKAQANPSVGLFNQLQSGTHKPENWSNLGYDSWADYQDDLAFQEADIANLEQQYRNVGLTFDPTTEQGKMLGQQTAGSDGFNMAGLGNFGASMANAFAEQDAENQARAQAVADQAMAEGMSMVGKPSANPGSMRQCNMFDMSGCEHKDMYRAGIFGA